MSVLLSDVDILTLKNPFDHLYRDEDVEALSDGFDKQTAYGEGIERSADFIRYEDQRVEV